MLEADPDVILNRARDGLSQNNRTGAQLFLEKLAHTPQRVDPKMQTISPISGGFALPLGVQDTRPNLDFKRRVQEEVKNQMDQKRKMMEEYANTELEIEKNIVKEDNERA